MKCSELPWSWPDIFVLMIVMSSIIVPIFAILYEFSRKMRGVPNYKDTSDGDEWYTSALVILVTFFSVIAIYSSVIGDLGEFLHTVKCPQAIGYPSGTVNSATILP